MIKEVYKCIKCNLTALWWLMGNSREDIMYCDTHVPRKGCSCYFDEELGDYEKDEQGRHYPCVDYLYSENGWDLDGLD